MIGAIAGDIAGSVHERAHLKRMDFELFSPNCRFTDDTVLTLAVAEAILEREPYGPAIQRWGRRYPDRGYGGMFRKWLRSAEPKPYKSFGNGSAMRVSPVGFAFEKLGDVLAEARATAIVTHDHPEGIKGAQAIAAAVFLARKGKDKKAIRSYIGKEFGYNLRRRIAKIRPSYTFDVTCQGSVPEALLCFLESTDVESAIRLGISLGGDADTIACMAGGIAQAFYKEIPRHLVDAVQEALSAEARDLLNRFCLTYRVPGHVIIS